MPAVPARLSLEQAHEVTIHAIGLVGTPYRHGGNTPEAGLPGRKKPPTEFDIVQLGADRVLRMRADRSYGNLTHILPATNSAYTLRWRWRLDQPIVGADLHTKSGDDTPLLVCALFDLPLDRLGIELVDRRVVRCLDAKQQLGRQWHGGGGLQNLRQHAPGRSCSRSRRRARARSDGVRWLWRV